MLGRIETVCEHNMVEEFRLRPNLMVTVMCEGYKWSKGKPSERRGDCGRAKPPHTKYQVLEFRCLSIDMNHDYHCFGLTDKNETILEHTQC